MYKSFTPTGFLNSSGASDDGSLFQSSTLARTSNLGATLTAVRNFEWFTNTTKLAYVFEDQSINNVNVFAASLTVPKVPEFSSADPAQDIFPGSRSVTIRNQNLFAITTFDIRDRYIFDALVRQDQSSLFGADQRTAIYNRVSAAYRLSEDLPLPGIDEFKLRASYGTAGLRPSFDAQYEIFSLVGGSPTPVTLGNRDLRPAFSATSPSSTATRTRSRATRSSSPRSRRRRDIATPGRTPARSPARRTRPRSVRCSSRRVTCSGA
jgi:hypothetical protein